METMLGELYLAEQVEALCVGGRFQLLISAPDPGYRYKLLTDAFCVADKGRGYISMEIITDNAELMRPGRFNVALPLFLRWVSVVHYKTLLQLQAELHELSLLIPGMQHIH